DVVLAACLAGGAIGPPPSGAGVVRGLPDAGRLPPPDPAPAVVPPYAYYSPFWYHGPWGFAPWGFLFPLVFIGLMFVFLRGLFWGRGCSGHGSWSADAPSRFEEGHRRAHESTPKHGQSA